MDSFSRLPADVAARIRESAHAVLQLRFTPAQNLPETASRIGGVGYWPAHLDYPANAAGQPLALLAQFNLAELPRHPELPEHGILAFYIDITDDMLGMDDTDGARCVYFADTAAPSLTRDEQLDLLPRAWREQLSGENADAEHDEDDDYTPSEEALAFAARWQAEPAAVLQDWLTRREEAVARIGDAELTRLFAGEKAALPDWQILAEQVEADCGGEPPGSWYDISHAMENHYFPQSRDYAGRAADTPQMQRWLLADNGLSEQDIAHVIHAHSVLNHYLLTQGDPRWLQYWRHDPRAVILEDWAMQDELIRFYNDPDTTALWQKTLPTLNEKLDAIVAEAQAEHVSSAPELDSVLEAHMGEVAKSLRAGYMQADPARQAEIHNLEQSLLAGRMERLAKRFASQGFTAQGQAPDSVQQAVNQYLEGAWQEGFAEAINEGLADFEQSLQQRINEAQQTAELLQHYLHAQDAFIAAQTDPEWRGEMQQHYQDDLAELEAEPPQSVMSLYMALQEGALNRWFIRKGLDNPALQTVADAVSDDSNAPYGETAYCDHPAYGECALRAETATHYLLHDNNEATRHYGMNLYGYLKANGINQHSHNASEAFAELATQQATNHLLGAPRFSQYDPRAEDDADTVLLLQVDSGEHLMWGDSGTGHFFIRRQDLAAGRFENAWFYWDCH